MICLGREEETYPSKQVLPADQNMESYSYSDSPSDERDAPICNLDSASARNGYIRSPLSSDGSDGNGNDNDNETNNDLLRARERQRRWTVALFSLTTVLLFADQNLMSPNLTAIAEDFGLTDDERDRKLGGDISLAFFLVGAPASFWVGLLADTGNRARIFGWTVFVGEFACMLTYFVRSYPQLYVCRAVTGFSVGGALPVIYSVLGDLFGAEDRHVVSAVVSFGLGAGISLGQAVAGYLGPLYGWRLPFLVISLPALGCAAAVYCTVEDPERGAMERGYRDSRRAAGENDYNGDNANDNSDNSESESDNEGFEEERDGGEVALVPITSRSNLVPENTACTDLETVGGMDDVIERNEETDSAWKQHWKSTMALCSNKSVALSLLQGAPGCIPWGIINVFLNDYLSEDKGFSVQSATTVLMSFSVGYGLGLVVGGAGGKVLYQRDIRMPALLAGCTAILGCLPLWFLLNGVDSETPFAVAAASAAVAGMLAAPTGPIVKATLTNVTVPTARGQAFALFNLFDDFGKGLGPFLVSLLIVRFGGRSRAFNIGVLGWVLCGLANLAMFFTVEHDERMVRRATAWQRHSA